MNSPIPPRTSRVKDEMRHRTRRRRAGQWIAGLAVIAAIGATYQLTRPPELVWWTSPPIGRTELHVRILRPYGWILEPGTQPDNPLDNSQTAYRFDLVDRSPAILRAVVRHM